MYSTDDKVCALCFIVFACDTDCFCLGGMLLFI